MAPKATMNIDAKPAWPVSAKLMKRGDDYQLHVAFQFDKPERIKPQTYLGIDRSIAYLAAGAVMSLDGKETIETFDVKSDELFELIGAIEKNIATKQAKGKATKGDKRRARIADRHVHLCANAIVEMARKHHSQVIVEDLSYLPAPKKQGKKGKGFNRVLQRRQYQKLQDFLETKLDIAGLPPLRKVSAAYTASTCSQCGCVSKESFDKEDRSRFCCVECGYIADVHKQASANIVRKLPFLQLRSKEKQREIPEAQRTTWEQFARGFKV
jgi:IS605 OrfB family transposase